LNENAKLIPRLTVHMMKFHLFTNKNKHVCFAWKKLNTTIETCNNLVEEKLNTTITSYQYFSWMPTQVTLNSLE
jgi:hypothetical protein